MALVREPMVYDGFDAAEASAFDALLDVDAAALFGGYVSNGGGGEPSWAAAAAAGASSVLAFDRAARGHGGAQAHGAAAGEEEDECDAWIDAMDQSYGGAAATATATATRHGAGAVAPAIGYDATTGCFSLMTERRPAGDAGRSFGLLFPSTSCRSPDAAALSPPPPPARGSQKRPHVGTELPPPMTPSKKQCGAGRKTSKAKPAPTTPPKDPQNLAAKNRRERISERLRILQELVPNGTKVDLVTMLEKAISYVKFLQLQVKVLATDEFWPAQGGTAPEISQVKEALDAILSSASASASASQRGQLN